MSKLLEKLQGQMKALLAESDEISAKDDPTAEDLERITAIGGEMKALRGQIESASEVEETKAWSAKSAGMLPIAVPGVAPAERSDEDSPAQRQEAATKAASRAWYVKRFGDVPAAAEQIAKELYGEYDNGDFSYVAMKKHQDFVRYLRTGEGDRKYSRMLLLTPQQIIDAAADGATIAEIKSTMIEADDTLGGYLVPEDMRTGIIERLPGMTVVRSGANVITTSRDSVPITTATGGTSRYSSGVRVTWTNEQPTSGTGTTNATFGQSKIPVHTVMADTTISRDLLEDAVFDLAGYLARKFSEAMAIDEDEQFLVGDGLGKPQGILNGTAANGAPFDANVTTVNSGSAAALTADGIIKLPTNLDAQYRQAGAVWVFAKATRQAIELLKDGSGRYLLGDNNNPLGGNGGDRLRNYGIKESEAMPAIAANTYPVIFGHLQGYTIADRIGMDVMRYDDSTTGVANAIRLVARRRLGGQVLNPWAVAVMKVSA